MVSNLIEYRIRLSGGPTGPSGQMYDYQMAGNGIFVVAQRPGLSVCFPIGEAEVSGLPDLSTFIDVGARVHASILADMFVAAREACIETNNERLFYVLAGDREGSWQMHEPAQVASAIQVVAVDSPVNTDLYARTLIDVHSHHIMPVPNFSHTDTESEQGTFRIYGLLTNIFQRPTIRTRVQVYTHSYDFPPEWVFEIPKGVHVRPEPRPVHPAGRMWRGWEAVVEALNAQGGLVISPDDPLLAQVPGLRRRPGR